MAKKVFTWVAIAFLVFFIAFHPDTAAHVARSLGTLITNIGRGFGDFFTRLVS